MQKNGYIWGTFAALLVIAAVYAGVRIHNKGTQSTEANMGTTTVDLGNGQSIMLPPGVTYHDEGSTTVTAASSAIQPPSLNGTIAINNSLDPALQTALKTNEQALISQLKAAPTRIDLWLKLGTYRKIAGDYTGAVVAWQYVIDSGKSNITYIAYGNLAGIYMDYLKDYPKAETNYKAAIAISPRTVDYYRELYYLYKGFYKTNTSAAADILAQGLKANPNNPDLLALQAELKGSAK